MIVSVAEFVFPIGECFFGDWRVESILAFKANQFLIEFAPNRSRSLVGAFRPFTLDSSFASANVT